MSHREDLVECPVCHIMTPRDELVETTPEDTQGYFPSGIKVCQRCLSNIQYEAFQIEDEDLL